jgi:hypothetical protein
VNGAIVNAGDGDGGQPVVLGYICRELLAGERQIDELELRMSDFAETEGFALGCTYIETMVARPLAFGALVEALSRAEAEAVLLPSLLHLAVLGPQHEIKKMLEWSTGVRVLVL